MINFIINKISHKIIRIKNKMKKFNLKNQKMMQLIKILLKNQNFMMNLLYIQQNKRQRKVLLIKIKIMIKLLEYKKKIDNIMSKINKLILFISKLL